MSRIAKYPISLPTGVEARIGDAALTIKGSKGELSMHVNAAVRIAEDEGRLTFAPSGDEDDGWAQAGTARAIAMNLVRGVSEGFERRLQLVGVGYRAQAQGSKLTLSLGFSHPVVYELPTGVEAETPSPTEIVVRGIDKQQIGQVCAEIRGFRPPEPYKGKGVRYANEQVKRKEAKKK